MRDLSASESRSLANATKEMGENGFSAAIGLATAAAKKQMLQMNRHTVNGMSCEDFAVEAYIYITSRGQSLSFLSRRAKLIVIDNYRYECGRKTSKNRARYAGSVSNFHGIGKRDDEVAELPSNIPQKLKEACKGLVLGYNKKTVARRIGMHPASLSGMISDNRQLIESALM